MKTILEEIKREMAVLKQKKKSLLDLQRNHQRTIRYKSLSVMEKYLEEAYRNMRKYTKRGQIGS